MTRLKPRSRNRSRRIPQATLPLEPLPVPLRLLKINNHSIQQACLESRPSAPNPTSTRSSNPGFLRAALRRAWSLDPAVRDFVGLSENSWDFNEPNEMTGFGPIDRQAVGQLLARLLGEPDAAASDVVHAHLISPSGGDFKKAADPVENGGAGWRPAGQR